MDFLGAPGIGHEQIGVEGTDVGPVAVTIDLAEIFHCYMEAAVLRLQSIYPTASFTITDPGVVVSDAEGIDAIEIRKAVLSAVYREKIYAETLSMRLALLGVVTSR